MSSQSFGPFEGGHRNTTGSAWSSGDGGNRLSNFFSRQRTKDQSQRGSRGLSGYGTDRVDRVQPPAHSSSSSQPGPHYGAGQHTSYGSQAPHSSQSDGGSGPSRMSFTDAIRGSSPHMAEILKKGGLNLPNGYRVIRQIADARGHGSVTDQANTGQHMTGQANTGTASPANQPQPYATSVYDARFTSPHQAPGEPVQPHYMAARSRSIAMILALLFGPFGMHNFYLGYVSRALTQLFISIFSLGFLSPLSWAWAIYEGANYVNKKSDPRWSLDGEGKPLRD